MRNPIAWGCVAGLAVGLLVRRYIPEAPAAMPAWLMLLGLLIGLGVAWRSSRNRRVITPAGSASVKADEYEGLSVNERRVLRELKRGGGTKNDLVAATKLPATTVESALHVLVVRRRVSCESDTYHAK